MKRGDVVIAIMPRELGAPRPSVVIQSDMLVTRKAILICPLTTDVDGPTLARPTVEPTEANGLEERSQIMADKVVLSPRERCRKVIGRLDDDDIRALDAAIAFVVGLLDAQAPAAID